MRLAGLLALAAFVFYVNPSSAVGGQLNDVGGETHRLRGLFSLETDNSTYSFYLVIEPVNDGLNGKSLEDAGAADHPNGIDFLLVRLLLNRIVQDDWPVFIKEAHDICKGAIGTGVLSAWIYPKNTRHRFLCEVHDYPSDPILIVPNVSSLFDRPR